MDKRRKNLDSEIGDLILDKFFSNQGVIRVGKAEKLALKRFGSFLCSCEGCCLVFRIELPVWITEIRCVSRISEGVRV